MRRLIILLLSCLLFVLPFGTQAQQLPAVDPGSVSGDIAVAGTPILETVTDNIATRFTLEGYSGFIDVASNTTTEGFQQLCSGEIDIVMSDRAISPQEVDACTAASRPPLGFRIATTAVIVSVSNANDFATNLTSGQLQQIFSTALTWSEVNNSWTAEAISRYGPPVDSDAFNLFVTSVFGGNRSALVTAVGAQFTEDPGVRLSEIATSNTAIGFFDANYALNNTNLLRGVTLDGIAPTITTIANNTYPLSRPLLLYTTVPDFTQDPQVASFLNYYLTNITQEAAAEGLLRATEADLATARNRWLSASGQSGTSVPAPQATDAPVINPPSSGAADDISATATALANIIGSDDRVVELTPTPAPEDAMGPLFDLETQDRLLQARLDLEVTAQEVIGGNRPEGWSGSLDIENPQLPLLIRLDLEVLAAAVYGIENRPEGWFGAISSTQRAITRDIRHDLELLADDVFGTVRPIDWSGVTDPLLTCDRSTQALVALLQRNNLYTLTADSASLSYCDQVAIEISRFVEVNLLESNVSVGAEGVSIPSDVTIETTIAIAFYNTNATQRAGIIPQGTGISPIARSYLGFSNMTLVEGDGFLVFLEWQNTSLTQAEWRELPNVTELEFTPNCTASWCDIQG